MKRKSSHKQSARGATIGRSASKSVVVKGAVKSAAKTGSTGTPAKPVTAATPPKPIVASDPASTVKAVTLKLRLAKGDLYACTVEETFSNDESLGYKETYTIELDDLLGDDGQPEFRWTVTQLILDRAGDDPKHLEFDDANKRVVVWSGDGANQAEYPVITWAPETGSCKDMKPGDQGTNANGHSYKFIGLSPGSKFGLSGIGSVAEIEDSSDRRIPLFEPDYSTIEPKKPEADYSLDGPVLEVVDLATGMPVFVKMTFQDAKGNKVVDTLTLHKKDS